MTQIGTTEHQQGWSLKYGVCVPSGYVTNYQELSGLKTTQIYYLPVLEMRDLKSIKCGSGLLLEVSARPGWAPSPVTPTSASVLTSDSSPPATTGAPPR